MRILGRDGNPASDDVTAAYCMGYDDALRYAAELLDDVALYDLADRLREEADTPWEAHP